MDDITLFRAPKRKLLSLLRSLLETGPMLSWSSDRQSLVVVTSALLGEICNR